MPAILQKLDLQATTNEDLYQVPVGRDATVNVNLCNRGAQAVLVRISLSALATPTTSEYIEFDTLIPARSVLERTALRLPAGTHVIVYSDTATVSGTVYGEES